MILTITVADDAFGKYCDVMAGIMESAKNWKGMA